VCDCVLDPTFWTSTRQILSCLNMFCSATCVHVSSNSNRFGNRAFAAWHQLLVDRSPALISALPPPPAAAAAKDGAVTWQKALGNAEVGDRCCCCRDVCLMRDAFSRRLSSSSFLMCAVLSKSMHLFAHTYAYSCDFSRALLFIRFTCVHVRCTGGVGVVFVRQFRRPYPY